MRATTLSAIAGLLLLPAVRSLEAQTITGSIVGSVRDPGGASVPGATAQVTNASTGLERQTKTDERGAFVFSALDPGVYDLSIRFQGFKTAERRGIRLSASETLPVGDIALEVGELTESVTVTAEGAVVQTASAERSGTITTRQVENIMIRGRNVLSILQLLPGVVDLADNDMIERSWNLNVNGNRRASSSVTLDGMTMNQLGNQVNGTLSVSQDAVSEVKVLLGTYQAEYGRMSGANVQVITKSGTRDFHGLASYFKRHEQFNANNYFNNRLGVVKPRYRFNTFNYNIGGPATIPGVFNKNRDKLFFFFSHEIWPLRIPRPVGQLTVPSAAERAGDYSQSLDLNNRIITVRDPSANAPFPGNAIPASRLDSNGRALLNIFPQPNFFDRGISVGRYNYVFQSENEQPQRMKTLKLDFNPHSGDQFSFNFSQHSDTREGALGIPTAGSTNWEQMRKKFFTRGRVYVLRHQHIFSPTFINELSTGYATRPEKDIAEESQLERNQRSKVGFRAGQFNPASNPLDIIPNATFGGVTGPANLFVEGRFPINQPHIMWSLTDNVTRIAGRHTFKLGFYADRIWRNTSAATTFNGSFDFGRNANNPLDTGYAYSNAALGVFASYTETSSRPYLHWRSTNVEWFAQDNWKVNRRLTLDFGLRMSWIPPIFERERRLAVYLPDRFDPARAVQLIRPAMVGGQRVGQHPVTGQVYPQSVVGAIAPGTGDPANGILLAAQTPDYPSGVIDDRGVHFAPRVGFSLDPSGRGKTAIRGGIGVFYNRNSLGSSIEPQGYQTPLVNQPVVNFSTIGGLASSTGLLFPQAVTALDGEGKVPTVMNLSFSVQQDIGWGTVVDVAYLSTLGRHMQWVRNLAAIPFGTNFDPRNADPTNPRVPLSQAFLRPYSGYTNVNYREWAGTSNYHSLQATVTRRFTKGLEFGLAWTWSKAMDYNDADGDAVSNLVPVRVWNYGLASFDRTHVVKFNWLWDLPQAPVTNPMLRAVFNGWQLSGIASFVSGQPLGVGFSQVVAADITGSPTDGARIVVKANPVLPKGERTFSRNFRTDVFELPARGTIGNAARTLIRGPGLNNWDVSAAKNFALREPIRLQLRAEWYNAFNHTQFSALDTGARFDAQGRQVNARFGEFTAARNPRIIQLALRFVF